MAVRNGGTREALREEMTWRALELRAWSRKVPGRLAELPRNLRDRHLSGGGFDLATGAAAIGSWLAELPLGLADMPADIRNSLATRRGDFTPEQLYDLIPNAVKTRAENVSEFLGKRDLSHIESVKNSPHLENDIANVVFEPTFWNRARGAADMTAFELTRSALGNFAESLSAGIQATGQAAATGAFVGALLELPVSVAENFLLVQGNGKTEREAVMDIAANVAKRGLAGAGGTALFTGVAMLTGPVVGKVAVPLAIIGGVTYLWSAKQRIWTAVEAAAEKPELALQVAR